jgi:uncharacterized protein YkwD
MAVATKQKPKQTVHHKRRTGTHQKRSNHFVKTYWPYIPMLAIVGVGLFFNNLLANPSGVLSYATNTTPTGLLQATNTERSTRQLGTLAINEKLNQAAQAKANDMAARDYWSHTTPDGQEPWAFINTTGYTYLAAGENLAYGFVNSEETIRGWMNSDSHRDNMLSKRYGEVGFGIANAPSYQGKGNQTVVVALYATPSTANIQATTEQQTQNSQPIATTQKNDGTFTVSGVVPGEVKVSRIELVSGSATTWSTAAFTAIIAALGATLLYRHSKAWHRVIRKSETFVLRHKTLDILLVSGIMMAIILLGAGGFIQ